MSCSGAIGSWDATYRHSDVILLDAPKMMNSSDRVSPTPRLKRSSSSFRMTTSSLDAVPMMCRQILSDRHASSIVA